MYLQISNKSRCHKPQIEAESSTLAQVNWGPNGLIFSHPRPTTTIYPITHDPLSIQPFPETPVKNPKQAPFPFLFSQYIETHSRFHPSLTTRSPEPPNQLQVLNMILRPVPLPKPEMS